MAKKKIIVIGNGIIGASIAWYLVRDGADVTIIAAEHNGVATPNSFAWINANWGNPEPYFHLRRAAMAGWKRLAADIEGIRPNWCGSLCYDLPADRLEAFAVEHSKWGYGVERVGSDTIRALEPNLAQVPEQALLIAEEGMIEPVAATSALTAAALALGAKFISGTIEHLVLEGHRITGVALSGEIITADELVLAAGAASLTLAAKIGVEVPVEASPGLLMYTRPARKLIHRILVAPHLEMRQTDDNRIVAATSYAGSEPGDDPDKTARDVLEKVKAEVRNADELELERFTIGYRPMPKDGFPIVSRIRDLSGLYVAVTHSGITLASAIGAMVANEVMTGERDRLLVPYGHGRFTDSP